MRRNASTVVVMPGPAPAEILAAVGRSVNVALIRPPEPADDDGDGLAALAASWQAMWDVSRPEGPAGFEAEALKVLTAWRSGRFELPDYYLVLGPGPAGPPGPGAGHQGPDFYLGPLRTARPQRVAVVAATEPAQQAVGVLHALGSLPYGPWWPGLDQLIEAARTFYPGQLAGGTAATG